MVEQPLRKRQVLGSSPGPSSNWKMRKDSKVFKVTPSDWALYRRFILLLSAIAAVLLGTYFLGLTILSNLGTQDQTFTQQDRVAPPPPTLTGVPQATNSAELNIAGFAEASSTVALFLNGGKKDSQLADAEGKFIFEKVRLETGENEIYTEAKDSAGNESRQSAVYKVAVDQKPPKLEVTEPPNNATVSEEKGKQTFILVKGKAEENTTVTINEHQAILQNEGNFEYRLLLTEPGENKIKATAKDLAGNATTVEKTVIYQKLEGSPSQP